MEIVTSHMSRSKQRSGLVILANLVGGKIKTGLQQFGNFTRFWYQPLYCLANVGSHALRCMPEESLRVQHSVAQAPVKVGNGVVLESIIFLAFLPSCPCHVLQHQNCRIHHKTLSASSIVYLSGTLLAA